MKTWCWKSREFIDMVSCLHKNKLSAMLLSTATVVFIEGAACARTKKTDSASIYGVKMSNRFSCETLSLIDGDYRRETSARLQNCNNNGDFASICPQWVHAALSAAVVFTVSKYLASVYNFPPATASARLLLLVFILPANFSETDAREAYHRREIQHFDK